MKAGLYVFALAGEKARPFTTAGHRVEFVDVDGVYAAVERLDARPVVSEAALRAQHDIVAQVAGRVDAILPARFGSFVDAEELARVVALRRDVIAEALAVVRGRVQMTVRLFEAEGHPVPPLRGSAATGTAYLEDRRRVAAGRALPQAAAVAAAVKHIVAAARTEAGHGHVAATLYHLVDRADLGKYTHALSIFETSPGTGTLTVTGPWAPFGFVPDLWP
jgi:hypothetical protein